MITLASSLHLIDLGECHAFGPYVFAKALSFLFSFFVTATSPQLKRAFHRAAMTWHPDRHASSSDPEGSRRAAEMFKEAKDAYGRLLRLVQSHTHAAVAAGAGAAESSSRGGAGA